MTESEYRQDVPMDVYCVRMTSKHARHARSIADGNFTLGVRRAIEFAYRCREDPLFIAFMQKLQTQ